MGHDHHFLSRLDRVNREQVDFALSLYRDHERIGWILARVKLPDDASRVALAIEHGDRSPHVVVTRGGHFVTCLGPAMTLGTCPVVGRGELDRISREYATVTERKALRDKLQSERRAHGNKGDMFDRVLYGGPSLSREEFLAAAAFAPLMTDAFGKLLASEIKRLIDTVVALTPEFARARKSNTISGRYDKALLDFGWTFWCVQHTAVLYGMHVGELLDGQDEAHTAAITKALLNLPIIGGLSASVLRGAWALANMGPVAFEGCRRNFTTACTRVEIYSAAAALATLGLRHPAIEAEVRKVLETPRTGTDGAFPDAVGQLFLLAFNPETADSVREDRPFEQVVDESVGLWAVTRNCVHDSAEDLSKIMCVLPFFARAEAAQLFLPRERAREQRWTVNDSAWLMAKHYKNSRPPPAPKRVEPSRSGPCPCGSGKRYKRCCGAGGTDGACVVIAQKGART